MERNIFQGHYYRSIYRGAVYLLDIKQNDYDLVRNLGIFSVELF